ncbi:RAMP superfamily CRISPR-associated protein [uncultured Thiohalocapsa sp.]|uniref:RAMP superfamily CRISPR-associated protein n=1 Tax=uncultured Thiohalocapsa sp. TaxID=768990 RepID=UPI0025E25AB8|nr:RAMP superfamily CRISPR-associated protein [uncultured Thiohalocapsa sp.]
MARKIARTLTIKGRLVSQTPIHVGGAETGAITDMALAVDGLGRYYIPGTSLAGAIRAYAQAAPDDALWGYALGEDQGTASRVVIDDAPALDAPASELWHGNGIDRRSGTAADNIKYDREVLPEGTAFDFRLTLEVLEDEDADLHRGLLAQLLDALEAGEVPLGASATRGLGRVKLIGAECTEQDWATPEGILHLLSGTPGTDCRSGWQTNRDLHALSSPPRIRITIHWQPKGPLMSRSARDGVVVDSLPFVSRRNDGRLALALPGAGIKGAWRAHAERIVRTVLDRDHVADKHHEQVDVPLVSELFGRARRPDRRGGKAAGGSPAKGQLAFETCYARFALSSQQWDELEREESLWRPAPSSERPMAMAMHVAVDRWTGGAADSLLYNAVEPMGIAWEPLVLRLKLADEPRAQLALLWLVLRDFCTGRIPLGYGVNRGYGDLEVERVSIDGLGAVCDGCPDPLTLEVQGGEFVDTSIEPLISALRDAWATWLRSETEGATA